MNVLNDENYQEKSSKLDLFSSIRHILPADGVWSDVIYRARHLEDGTVEISDWRAERKIDLISWGQARAAVIDKSED